MSKEANLSKEKEMYSFIRLLSTLDEMTKNSPPERQAVPKQREVSPIVYD